MKFSVGSLSAVLLANGLTSVEALSPVTRVTELLENLSKKVESDAKAEEDLYDKYVCWAKTTVSEKTASNEAAKSRKESLQTYVADLDAGRVELTSERSDLTKEMSGLQSDIEQAKAMRAKEQADFDAAKAEMDQAVAGLTQAISVLDAGTKPASLLRLRAGSSNQDHDTFSSRLADGEAVSLVLRLVHGSISEADSTFLQRVLSADVPVKDWKKLNRKADFKAKYEARSSDIQKMLKSLLETFEENLKDATERETKAVEAHTALMGSKEEQLTTAQAALSSMSVEGSARGLSKSEAEAETEALTTQIQADEGFITDTNAALEVKKGEWKERVQIRADEIAAIGQAISILHSDDARDLMKKSLASQGLSFVQVKKVTVRAIKLHKVVAAAGGHFDKVITSIDTMITDLTSEEADDLKKKEGCEKARAEDTRQAITLSRAMDDLTDTMTKLKSEIEELNAQITEKKENIVQTEEALEKATRMRTDENTEWQSSDADDKAAAELVKQASGVLEKFYASNAFLQSAAARRQPAEGAKAGEAPLPPPSTWETPYKGAQEENTGVVAMLQMIEKDILKDQATAKEEEDAAQKAFDTFKTESETQITDLQTAISTMEGTIGEKETLSATTEADRAAKRGELEAVLTKIKDATPGCDFFLVHFKVRSENRQIEIDGLNQAKTVLAAHPATA